MSEKKEAVQAAASPIDAGKIIGIVMDILSDPIKRSIFDKIIGIIGGLFKKKSGQLPLPSPQEGPGGMPPSGTDEHIPPPSLPAGGDQIVKLDGGVMQVQYERARFPEEYNTENPFGMVPKERIRNALAGTENIPWGSKLWFTATMVESDGDRHQRADTERLKLAYKLSWVCGLMDKDGTVIGSRTIVGKGSPNAGSDPGAWDAADQQTQGDVEGFNVGSSAWVNTLGYNLQVKVFGAADGLVFFAEALYSTPNGVISTGKMTLPIS